MKTLRLLHLYLGCVFSPLLLVFTASGLWQLFGLQKRHAWMASLSSLHIGHANRALLRAGGTDLSSPGLKWLCAAMAAALAATIVLGVVLAFRMGRVKITLACLLLGAVIPALVIAFA